MKFWLLVIIIIFFQETVTTSGIMMDAYQKNHGNLIYLILIFLATTICEIPLAFKLGKSLKKNKKLISWLKRQKIIAWILKQKITLSIINQINNTSEKAGTYVGNKGKKIFLAYASTAFPSWFNAFISPWFDLTLKEIFPIILFGATIWYVCILLVVLGISYYVKNAQLSISIIFVISITFVILQKVFSKKS
jgi:drug/metabolite transporter superfamily protein YnfA